MTGGAQARLHATTVAFDCAGHWAALAILGRSGAGKSELGLQLMALGARLVADDQTLFTRNADGTITAHAPDPLRGLIEMRGIGLLPAPSVTATLRAVVDLDQRETDRLPPARHYTLLGRALPCLHRVDSPAFAAALKCYIYGTMIAETPPT